MTALQFDYQALAYGPGITGLCLMALVLDALFGNAPGLRRLFPHPALIMAALIGGLARKLNRPERGAAARLVRGLIVELVIVGLAVAAGYGLAWLTDAIPFFWLVTLLLLVALTILRGPFDEAGRVTLGYTHGLAGAREAAVNVIGPGAQNMNAGQINRALAEHLAGRFADGLVAGIFWLLLMGLPGFLLWRAVNIAGRLLDDGRPEMAMFGLIATRINEALGLLPAWLAALTLALAAIFVPGANPLRALSALFSNNKANKPGRCRHSERAAVVAALAALAEPGKANALSGADVVRAQYLYAVACLLVFALVVLWTTLRYAI